MNTSLHKFAEIYNIASIVILKLTIADKQAAARGIYPKCEVRYGPALDQPRQKSAEDRLPISCRCWNDNSGIHLSNNSGANSGRQHLFSAQQRANAVSNSGFLTSRMVCRGKSDTWPGNMPSMDWTLALLLSELDVIVKVTIGLVH